MSGPAFLMGESGGAPARRRVLAQYHGRIAQRPAGRQDVAIETRGNDLTQLAFDDVPFRGIVEQAIAGIYVVLNERFMYANDTFAAMFGYSRAEFIGRRMVDCVTTDSVDEVMRNYRLRISGQVSTIHYFTKGVHRDGRIVHLRAGAKRPRPSPRTGGSRRARCR